MYDVIDISHWNGKIDFNKVKASGIKGVIIKCGGSDGAKNYYKDKQFETYYNGAKKAGLLVGAYWFAGKQINTMAMGINEGMNCLSVIQGKQFELPIFIDYEVGNKKTKKGNTEAIIGFCEFLEGKRYYVGVYGSDSNTFNEMVDKKRLVPYYWWVAKYSSKAPVNNHHMWQYTSTGKVTGIKGNVDISHVYLDVSEIIPSIGYNGFSQLNQGGNNG